MSDVSEVSAPDSETRAPARGPGELDWIRVHLALFFVQLLFSGFHVVGKAVLADLPPLALAGLRVGLAAPLLLAVAAWRGRVLPPLPELPRPGVVGAPGRSGRPGPAPAPRCGGR